ncbi:MAG: ATP-grasp domain-containing protein [Candidatus Latescibacteria bacterium]|jgi:carbamoyl-phosphate synthase large subunit|nr:ATP-grasp domain-containing protein [Candidatus Latescibacterota bacterium]
MINVLVTAVGGNGNGSQILKALVMAENGAPGYYRIYGTDRHQCMDGLALDGRFAQLPDATSPEYLPSVLKLCSHWNVDVLFPGSDAELFVFAENMESFIDLGVCVPIQRRELIEWCRTKVCIQNHMLRLGIPVPQSYSGDTPYELNRLDNYPYILKPTENGGGSRGVYIAQDYEEIRNLFGYLKLKPESPAYILQEYIGKTDSEFSVGILHDGDGVYVGGVALNRDLTTNLNIAIRIRNISKRQDLGAELIVSSGISQGRIGGYLDIVEQCRNIAETLLSTGPLNIQCRVVENKVIVFEINPRLSGSTSLRALVGFNEPDLLVKRFHQRDVRSKPQGIESVYITRKLIEIVE